MQQAIAITQGLDCIEEALADLQDGRCIVVVDDEHRENEGDLICAAQNITPEIMNFILKEARGCVCLALTTETAQQLNLELMVKDNQSQFGTAFTITIDADLRFGVSTGVSAFDRAKTIQVAISPECTPEDLRRPGHTFPLIARAGGVLERAGHTEAAVDLACLAGFHPSAVLCEILSEDGSMARINELRTFCRRHKLRLISIAQLAAYQLNKKQLVEGVEHGSIK